MPEQEVAVKPDKDLQSIIDRIRRQKCILILGPEIFVGESNNSYLDELVAYLKKNKHLEIEKSDEGFLHFGDKVGDATNGIIDFHHLKRVNSMYELIAQIPFHFIISLSPDNQLEETYKRLNIPYISKYYLKGAPQEKESGREGMEPSEYPPIIYHLLGSSEDNDSLIFTFSDLFDYLESILGTYKTPEYFDFAVRKMEHCVILGFQYDKWYFKLLFKLLNKKLKSSFNAYYDSKIVNDEIKKFYQQNLSITLVESNPREFISNLFDSIPQELLRKGSQKLAFAAEIENCLTNNYFKTAFSKLKNRFSDFDNTNVAGDYNRIEESRRNHSQTQEQIDAQLNSIKIRIRDFLNGKNLD